MYFSISPAPSPTSSINSIYSVSPTASTESSTRSPSCAYPSWPRRTSLTAPSPLDEATSFISDDDLFPDVFDDNESDCSPLTSPRMNAMSMVEPATMKELVQLSKSTIGSVGAEKKHKSSHRRRNSSRKSRTSSTGKELSPILEGGE